MKAILLDPSIGSANVGDQIISESVISALAGHLTISGVLPTQRSLTSPERKVAAAADLAIVAGTNLLSSNMPWYRQWKIGPISALSLQNKVVLMGVGWWQYQDEPNFYTRWLLSTVLSHEHTHSVRDEYTKSRLERLGYKVSNTACPTMWKMPPTGIPGGGRPSTCVVTLTDYNRDESDDQWLINEVSRYYSRVFVWPQSQRDVDYAERLTGNFTIAQPTLTAYDELLSRDRIDYVGTRLHGGIRAAQRGHWLLIVAVDNRGLEIGRDTGLNVIARGDRDSIAASLKARSAISVALPSGPIERWLNQFA